MRLIRIGRKKIFVIDGKHSTTYFQRIYTSQECDLCQLRKARYCYEYYNYKYYVEKVFWLCQKCLEEKIKQIEQIKN